MKKLFICLANSKKYGERCVAGIEVFKKPTGKWSIVRHRKQPKWIRPVTKREHGAIPEKLVAHMQLLDIYEVDIIRACPNGYQSENVSFRERSFRKVSRVVPSSRTLQHLLDTERTTIFTNRGTAVIEEKIDLVDYSLAFIKVEQPKVYIETSYYRYQPRIAFLYQDTSYNFSITDVSFLAKYDKNPQIVEQAKEVYLTVSLGIAFEGWYYKLAAGVICI